MDTERSHEPITRTTPPVWLAYAASGTGLLLGAAHLTVTGGLLLSEARNPTPGYLAWMFVPVLIALAIAAVPLTLIDPRRARSPWPRRACGAIAVLTAALALFGLAPLAFGAAPLSLFLGPGPYALTCAVAFTALTLSTRRPRP
ncbi:hypothetical protein ACFYOC_18585 [Nocardiopsis alba]|uniref:hypothetical protein n=1 Tax=Nocardiopsis alba TaxID=53437 RepID=UPI0005A89583|nr:hypothetical protein [Nocardiopsis alba]